MNVERIKESLATSPLFNLSLSSKELFHSNFLYWIGQRHPALFREICKELGYEADWGNRWTAKREYKNFDLCVETDEHIRLVLENKVKSIPSIGQLEKYAKETEADNCDLILLSLASQFPHKQDIENQTRWKVRNYNDLHDAILRYKDRFVMEQYESDLLEDYCQFIKNMHELAESWSVTDNSLFLLTKDNKSASEELRIGDLQDKIWYSALMERLNELLQAKGFMVVPGKKIEEIKAEKNVCLNRIFTNWGFTHGQGLLEAKVRINNDYVLLIQLQGDRYCHCIEWIADKNLGHAGFWESTKKEELIKELSFFQFEDEREGLAHFPAICQEADQPVSPRRRKGETRIYCKYGDRFLYQAKKISPKATVSEVLTSLTGELEHIVETAMAAILSDDL